jgi:hypothetical protein
MKGYKVAFHITSIYHSIIIAQLIDTHYIKMMEVTTSYNEFWMDSGYCYQPTF